MNPLEGSRLIGLAGRGLRSYRCFKSSLMTPHEYFLENLGYSIVGVLTSRHEKASKRTLSVLPMASYEAMEMASYIPGEWPSAGLLTLTLIRRKPLMTG